MDMAELAPMMCLASVDMGLRYQKMREKLSAHEVLKDLAQAASSRAEEYKARTHVLEKKVAEMEENLKAAFAEVDQLKAKEAQFIQGQEELGKMRSLTDELSAKLKAAEADKEHALLELKDRYTEQMNQEIQEAYNMGYSEAIAKYNIQISDAEDDEEGELEGTARAGSPAANDPSV